MSARKKSRATTKKFRGTSSRRSRRKRSTTEDHEALTHPVLGPIVQSLGLKPTGTGFAHYKVEGRDVFFFIATLTPEAAANILANHNEQNRFRRGKDVKSLAKKMLDDKWYLNGDTISFTLGGDLTNGGHRVCAVRWSGTAQDFPIIIGVDPTGFTSLDSHARRKLKHALQIQGMTYDALRERVARQLYSYENDMLFLRRHPSPTIEEGLEALDRFPLVDEAIHFVAGLKVKHPPIPADLAALAYIVLGDINLIATRFFLYHLLTERRGIDEGIDLLLSRLTQIKESGMNVKDSAYLRIHAKRAVLFQGWNVFCKTTKSKRKQTKIQCKTRGHWPDGAHQYVFPKLDRPTRETKRMVDRWFNEGFSHPVSGEKEPFSYEFDSLIKSAKKFGEQSRRRRVVRDRDESGRVAKHMKHSSLGE